MAKSWKAPLLLSPRRLAWTAVCSASVGNADIADAITATGVEVKKAEVRLPEGPFKAIGEYSVEVALHHDVVVTITLQVTGAA